MVYAKFDLKNSPKMMSSDPSVTYNVVFNVTNLSDKAATLYELTFAAAQDITSSNPILGGNIYDQWTPP